LTADSDGCDALEAILAKHEGARSQIQARILLRPATPEILAVPNNRRGNPTVVSLVSLTIVTDPTFDRGHFEFNETHPYCTLLVSPNQAGCILEGVKDIRDGNGDYCVGDRGNNVLWFWWFGQSKT